MVSATLDCGDETGTLFSLFTLIMCRWDLVRKWIKMEDSVGAFLPASNTTLFESLPGHTRELALSSWSVYFVSDLIDNLCLMLGELFLFSFARAECYSKLVAFPFSC